MRPGLVVKFAVLNRCRVGLLEIRKAESAEEFSVKLIVGGNRAVAFEITTGFDLIG